MLRFRCANLKPKDLVRAWVARFEGASHAYVLQRRKLADGGRAATPALLAARRAFEGDRFPGDRAEPYTALCFRDRDPLADEGFVRWAETLWGPLLDHAEDV